MMAVGVAIATCLIPLDAMAASFTGLNIFGDSLVDSGNLFKLTSAFSPLGIPALPPSPPYAQKSSNGPIWIDNVGQSLGLSPTLVTDLLLNPATPSPTQGVNFAFTGSLSSNIHVLDDDILPLAPFLPGFQEQILAFSTLSAAVPVDPNALYVIWVGGNDYNEAFFNPASLGGLPLDQLPNAVTDNIVNGIAQLSSLGAESFLVANLPSLGEAPFADFLDAVTQQDISTVDISTMLNQLTQAHNALLTAKLSSFGQSQPSTKIISLDVNTLFADVLANPSAFGLTNVTDPCLTNFKPGFQFDGICSNPDEFLFWDNVHPTSAAYRLVSDLALATLNSSAPPASVPEPGGLTAVFVMGVTGAGALVKRRLREKAVS